jgi:hypothetical protein
MKTGRTLLGVLVRGLERRMQGSELFESFHFISLLVKFGIIVVAYRLPIYAESASVDGVRAFYIHTHHTPSTAPLYSTAAPRPALTA